MSDNDFQLALADITRNLGEKITRILNSQSHNETACKFLQESIANIKRITEGFIKIAEDIANGTLKPDKEFIQDMIDIYKRNPADIPESIRDYIRELAETENTDNRPVIKATTHKANAVMIGTTKAGRKLHDKDELPALFDKGIIFPTGTTHSKSPKPVDTIMSLSFEVLDEWKDFMPKSKKITPFVLELLTHFMTLKHAGNEWTSTSILFRQMNGGDNDKKPTKEFIHAVYDSLWVLACTRIKIDATQEHKAGYNNRNYYQGSLLSTSVRGREIVTINGCVIEDAIHILEQSPLFEYALAKGQVTPIPIGMYNVARENKRSLERTEENTVILGYLIRAFADMVNEKSDRDKHIIRYDTLFEYLSVEGKTPTQLRKNKAKIRNTVRDILTSWKNGGFIKDFHELGENDKSPEKGKEIAKVWIDTFSKKEYDAIHKGEILSLDR